MAAIPPPRPGTTPTRWEYLCVDAAQLNAAGAQGWELSIAVPYIYGMIGGISGGSGGGGSITSTATYCLRRALP